MKAVIINYNSGNIRSVAFALERIGINAIVSENAEEIRSADHVIFPGVGEAGTAMRFLRKMQLDKLIVDLKQPVLGICLGMQLMCRFSEEGNTDCLGIFDQDVKRFRTGMKVPQVGWNTLNGPVSPIFKNTSENEYQYFVHGYYAGLSEWTVATTEYGIRYSSALQKNNFYGVQFHPEKSGAAGQKILTNFFNEK